MLCRYPISLQRTQLFAINIVIYCSIHSANCYHVTEHHIHTHVRTSNQMLCIVLLQGRYLFLIIRGYLCMLLMADSLKFIVFSYTSYVSTIINFSWVLQLYNLKIYLHTTNITKRNPQTTDRTPQHELWMLGKPQLTCLLCVFPYVTTIIFKVEKQIIELLR